MKDADAKEIMAKWPDPLIPGTAWRRLRLHDEKDAAPYLFILGSRQYSVISDCLYGLFGCDKDDCLEFVDVLAIEVCATRQNFYDKRSRYAEQNPLGIYCQESWLRSADFLRHVAHKELQNIPVRYRAVLYALSSAEFELAKEHLSPWGNEYFVDYDDLPAAGVIFGNLAIPRARFIQTLIKDS